MKAKATLVVLMLLGLSLFSQETKQKYDSNYINGLKLYRARDFVNAEKEFLLSAKNDHPYAIIKLGDLYYKDNWDGHDFNKSILWYKKALKYGDRKEYLSRRITMAYFKRDGTPLSKEAIPHLVMAKIRTPKPEEISDSASLADRRKYKSLASQHKIIQMIYISHHNAMIKKYSDLPETDPKRKKIEFHYERLHPNKDSREVGMFYYNGMMGLEKNHEKAFEYFSNYLNSCLEKSRTSKGDGIDNETIGKAYAYMAMMHLDPKSEYSKKDVSIGNGYLNSCKKTGIEKCVFRMK